MLRRIRVPWIVDLLYADGPMEVRRIADDEVFDRRFAARGPLVNLIVANRMRTILAFRGGRLPSVAPRGDRGRARRQGELTATLERVADERSWDSACLSELARIVRGEVPVGRAGPVAQSLIGRLFHADYKGDETSWEAAQTFNSAPGANPFRLLALQLTGRLRRARRTLAERARGDLHAIHATGIAVHNLVVSIERMRALHARSGGDIPTDQAVMRCLAAPERVLRQSPDAASTPFGEVRRGTIAVLQVESAREKAPEPETAFLADGWGRCPAHRLVPELLGAVWAAAKGGP
jgi:hypothetical protein